MTRRESGIHIREIAANVVYVHPTEPKSHAEYILDDSYEATDLDHTQRTKPIQPPRRTHTTKLIRDNDPLGMMARVHGLEHTAQAGPTRAAAEVPDAWFLKFLSIHILVHDAITMSISIYI